MKRYMKSICMIIAMGLFMITAVLVLQSRAESGKQTRFTRISPQWIAALGDPGATSGNNAQTWGLWRQDPGPRGVKLENYQKLKAAGGIAPAMWKFDDAAWWLEEHGLIMEKPVFPVPAGKYVVTGGRWVTGVLTVYPADKEGAQLWELDNGVKLYDVTHLPCRSAVYTPSATEGSCSPLNAQSLAFPVKPGAPMPAVEGCNKQDYSVLIVIGVAVE